MAIYSVRVRESVCMCVRDRERERKREEMSAGNVGEGGSVTYDGDLRRTKESRRHYRDHREPITKELAELRQLMQVSAAYAPGNQVLHCDHDFKILRCTMREMI